MADKHIFIGLGGSGVKTVSLIKFKIYQRVKPTELKSSKQVMDENYRFIFMDTDSRDVRAANEQYRTRFEDGKEEFIGSRELVNLGDINPFAVFREAQDHPEFMINRRITEACPPRVASSMDNRDLSFGAGALRLKSRIAFARKTEEFGNKLQECINQLNGNEIANETNVFHYWVVSSCNGGTGSGTVMDVLYQVNMIHRTFVNEGDPKVGLLLYMPRIYMQLNSTNKKYPLNAYAVMKEISAFQSIAKSESDASTIFHRLALRDDFSLFDTKTPYRPFEFCIPVDFHTQDYNNLGDIDKMYSNTAELLFYIHSGAGAEGFKSFLDNYEDGQSKIADDSFLIPMGYMAIRKPEEQFESYIASRAKYEMLRYGIIGAPVKEEQRKELMKSLFNAVIKPILFEQKAGPESYFSILSEQVNDIIEENLPENIIRDNKNNVVNKLPSNVSIEEAKVIIGSVEQLVKGLNKEKKKACDNIKAKLWNWVEENTRKYGLQYVKDILQELDTYCSELYVAYTTDTEEDTDLKDLKFARRKDLVSTRDGYPDELDNLYQKALQVTIPEMVTGGNRNEVQVFFSSLKEWVQASADVMIANSVFDILNELSVGDKGVIDGIIVHVRQLLAAATATLNDGKGVQKDYINLAKGFMETKLDVTSVYLPDITTFADSTGWLEDGNVFSQWYSLVIGHTNEYHQGEGFEPLRNGGNGSLEWLFSEMVSFQEQNMIQNQYFVDNESRLFTNISKTNKKRVIEDILGYTVSTVKSLITQQTVVRQQWYEKSLANLCSELNSEARIELQHKCNPPLFFPFNRAQKSTQTVPKAFSVGPKEIAKALFGAGNDNAVYDSSDDSVMYKLVTKLGMTFDYYDLYENIEKEYRACASKEFYHFHQAYARTPNGDPRLISLPKEVTSEQVVFVKYLLLNQLCRTLSVWMKAGVNEYEKDTFAPTPLIRTATMMRFAKADAMGVLADDKIHLLKSEAGIDHFVTVRSSRENYRWTDFLQGFEKMYSDCQFEQLAKDLIEKLSFLAGEDLRAKFNSAWNAIKKELNALYLESKEKTEKETLRQLLRILDSRLSSYDKFANTQYFG